jgi:hypothetical protein
MLQIKNETPFKVMLLPLPDRDGIDTVYAIVKGTFSIGAHYGLSEEQLPVALADQHYGDPATTSVRIPSDVCLEKPGTDVLMIGSAWAPGGRPTWQMDVSVAVGPAIKTSRVFGDRVWNDSGTSMTWVAPFERMPLVWERAFGGRDETPSGMRMYAPNPVGVGFRAADGIRSLRDLPLPNVEDPRALIQSWKDAPPPAGFAPVAPHWEPRRSYAGTYDAAWQEQRAPYLPRDFDARFFHLAPPGLTVSQRLRGGEPVEVSGATADGVLRFVLPAAQIEVAFSLDRGTTSHPAELDTVVIEPDAARLTMVWRAAHRCDKAMLKVREVRTSIRQQNDHE